MEADSVPTYAAKITAAVDQISNSDRTCIACIVAYGCSKLQFEFFWQRGCGKSAIFFTRFYHRTWKANIVNSAIIICNEIKIAARIILNPLLLANTTLQ
jgi:hypothetical protein